MPDKISVFVDVQNIYYTTRQAYGAHFDYNAFWAKITQGREVINAYAYAIDRQDEKQRQFQNILRAIGFTVKLKPYIQRSDGSSKGDWDVGITIDMLECASESDVIVLASGDGDFDILVHTLRQKHQVGVEVYGVPMFSATSLINAASRFMPIEQPLLIQPRG
ncbi:NYN domain-containing protein [Endozoicomonas sp. Mp262]|uniref:LabA-like NYN domain-containing protein n=1 Tax=Endozoicomonas sp. Mp262 TaxID=2919499 RepID=UPI0021D8DBDE